MKRSPFLLQKTFILVPKSVSIYVFRDHLKIIPKKPHFMGLFKYCDYTNSKQALED